MASSEKNLSTYQGGNLGNLVHKKIVLVVSEWNDEITNALYDGAYNTLIEHGATKENLTKIFVPGSFELPLAAKWYAESNDIDAVICLGCVIQGETRHFDFICQACADGVMKVGIDTGKPVIFGVLTTDNKKQALDRAGGRHGNKGDEAAITAIKMLNIKP